MHHGGVQLHHSSLVRQASVADGDVVRIESPRGAIDLPARLTGVREGVVFIPFHYGSWGQANGTPRAANELTMTEWDPVSKQPYFKIGAVRITTLKGGR